jgi:hypothetical protein
MIEDFERPSGAANYIRRGDPPAQMPPVALAFEKGEKSSTSEPRECSVVDGEARFGALGFEPGQRGKQLLDRTSKVLFALVEVVICVQ